MKNVLDSIKQYTGVITGIAAVIGIAFGAVSFVDSRYTLTTDFSKLKVNVLKLESRQSLDELRQALQKALQELYFYRKLLRENPNDETLIQEVEELEEEVAYLKERIREEEEAQEDLDE